MMVIGEDGIRRIQSRLAEIDAAEKAHEQHAEALNAFFAGTRHEAPPGGYERADTLLRQIGEARAALEGCVRGILDRERSRDNRSFGATLGWETRRKNAGGAR
jgi:hypothetical protein